MPQKPFVLPSGVDFYAGDGTAAGAADPLLVVSDSTNKVGINSQTPTGTLDITTASSSDRGLIVRGLASQSSSIVETQDSGGNTLSYFGPSGVIGGSGINVNQYHTSASGSPRFRVAIGNNNWAEYPNFPKISTYGSIVAQGVQLVNDSTLQVTVSGYTTGSLTGVYYYRITAVGPNGEENPYSPGYATTPITSIPPGTPSGVVLTWTNPTTNYIPVAKWRIYRGTANQAYTAGTMGTANPFTTTNSPSSYRATAVGTSVYFDTADGNVSSFTDSGSAGTVGFPPDHFRGAEGWLAANRGLYTPELFTCIAQGGYSIARAVNVNGVIFTNAAIDGGNSNAKTMQMPSLAIQMTDSAGIFQISNTTLTNASLQVSVSATNGGYLIVNDGYGMKSRLGPHITNTLSDSSSASGIAYYFNTSSALTDPRKLMSVQNSATERFAISAYGTTTYTLGNATAKGIVITAAASQSANLLEIQRSDGSTLHVVDSAGKVGIGSGITPAAMIDASGSSISTVVQINRAASGQTANIYQAKDYLGNDLVWIDASGRVGQHIFGSPANMQSTAFGYNAMANATSAATLNTAFGYGALVGGGGSLSGTRNVAIGTTAGANVTTGSWNVLIGYVAGNTITTGSNNILIGYNTSAATGTLTNTISIGVGTLGSLTTGTNNLAIGGDGALNTLTTGNDNTAVGNQAGRGGASATFSNNTYIGKSAGLWNTYGSSNTTIGAYTLCGNQGGITQSGEQCVAVGTYALGFVNSGVSNTAVGYNSLGAVTYGTGITAIGAGTSTSAATTGSYSIIIGMNAQASQNYQLVIGSSSQKVGKSDGTGEQTISSITPSGISKLLEARINGTIYNIPLLPSGSTDLQNFTALNVASGITIPSGTPAITTSKLYASGTTLYFNGSTVGGGGGTTTNALTFASGLTFTTSTFNGSAAVTIGLPSTTVFGAGTSGWVPYYNSTSGIAISSGQSVYLGTVISPATTSKTLIAKAIASQSVNIFEVQNSSGSGVFSVDQSGSVYFAPWSGTSVSPIKYDGVNNRMVFTGSGTAASGINLNVLNDSTLSFESTAGQLFSISDGLASGTIFSVNDISGMSSIEVDASGLIKLGEYDGFIGIGTSQTFGQYSGKMEINAPSGYKGLIVRNSTGGTGNLFEAQSSTSGALVVIDASGEIGINNSSPAAMLDIASRAATVKGIIIKNAVSQSANIFEVQNSSSTPLLVITPSGAISGAIAPTILTTTTGITLTDSYNGYIIEYNSNNSGTMTLTTSGNITIPSWNCSVVQIGTGIVTVTANGNTLRSPGSLIKARTQYSSLSLYRRGTGDFVLGGDLA